VDGVIKKGPSSCQPQGWVGRQQLRGTVLFRDVEKPEAGPLRYGSQMQPIAWCHA